MIYDEFWVRGSPDFHTLKHFICRLLDNLQNLFMLDTLQGRGGARTKSPQNHGPAAQSGGST